MGPVKSIRFRPLQAASSRIEHRGVLNHRGLARACAGRSEQSLRAWSGCTCESGGRVRLFVLKSAMAPASCRRGRTPADIRLLMSAPRQTTAALRIWGDDLLPDEVSRLLGAQPSYSKIKGEVQYRTSTGGVLIAKTGTWHFAAREQQPGDLDAQIEEIFAVLTDDPQIWRAFKSRFELDLFCGVFMQTSNDDIGLSPAHSCLLGERGIDFRVSVYAPLKRARRARRD